jgi:branched-chain amino acid transport system ATP-binding protein
MSETMLRVENLVVRYGDIRAVKGISFHVQQGEILALVGANGAGKTTTLRAISGMLPFEGSVDLQGRDLRGLTPDRILRLGLSHVPEGRGIFGGLTVMENLQLGAWIQSDKAARTRDLDMVMDIFPRLRERATQLAGTLSGGEQQMLTIARTLMGNPAAVLLDEPSEGLAPVILELMAEAVLRMKREGIAVLLSEQNFDFAAAVADRAYVIERGEIRYDGSMAALDADPALRGQHLML